MVTARVGPMLRKRQLARELSSLRDASGVSHSETEQALGCSRSKVVHLHTGRNLPTRPDLEVLLRLYGALDRFDVLEEIRVAARAPGWWSTYKLPPWMNAYVGLESDAVRVRCFALELVPGLVQVEGYARDTLTRQGNTSQGVERGVQVRVERQSRIGEGLSVDVVVSEAVLCRTVHMTSGAEQLDRLASAGRSGPVDVRVLPFSVGGHRSMSGSFTLLDFPPESVDQVAYREGALHGELTDDAQAVQELDDAFASLRDQALDRYSSSVMIAELVSRNDHRRSG